MPSLPRAWIAAARARDRLTGRRLPREELVLCHAPGRTFVDVGCMWSVDGALAFLAEEAGATRVTGVDIMPATDRFLDEHARRGSRVRFVRDDIHDPVTIAEVGVHDVVWCSGLLHHGPDPLLTLERLRELSGEVLLLATETVPELPGLRGASVPLDPAKRDRKRWWGITPSAFDAMLDAAGFEIVERHASAFHAAVVARPRG